MRIFEVSLEGVSSQAGVQEEGDIPVWQQEKPFADANGGKRKAQQLPGDVLQRLLLSVHQP